MSSETRTRRLLRSGRVLLRRSVVGGIKGLGQPLVGRTSLAGHRRVDTHQNAFPGVTDGCLSGAGHGNISGPGLCPGSWRWFIDNYGAANTAASLVLSEVREALDLIEGLTYCEADRLYYGRVKCGHVDGTQKAVMPKGRVVSFGRYAKHCKEHLESANIRMSALAETAQFALTSVPCGSILGSHHAEILAPLNDELQQGEVLLMRGLGYEFSRRLGLFTRSPRGLDNILAFLAVPYVVRVIETGKVRSKSRRRTRRAHTSRHRAVGLFVRSHQAKLAPTRVVAKRWVVIFFHHMSAHRWPL